MDTHCFRLAGAELIRLFSGGRVEKIHSPTQDVLVLLVFAQGQRHRLLFSYAPAQPFFALTPLAPANPSVPPAFVMRLRKYLGGKRLGPGLLDYPARRLAFPIGSNDALWLLLDMRAGLSIISALPEDFGVAPPWPDVNAPALQGDSPWQQYAVLSPLLRETLLALEQQEASALLADLEAGGGDLFLYSPKQGRVSAPCAVPPVFYSAWPLPESLLHKKNLCFWGQQGTVPPVSCLEGDDFTQNFPVLTKISQIETERFFASQGQNQKKQESRPVRVAEKRLERLVRTLELEQERLIKQCALGEEAKLLQAVLWQYAPDHCQAQISVLDPATGAKRLVELDPLLSVRENMEKMFRLAGKGKRGLSLLSTRLAEAKQGLLPPPGTLLNGQNEVSPPLIRSATQTLGERQEKNKGKAYNKDVSVFYSSDGYTLLRGKNAAGNRSLLGLGQPYDFWLHATDGPSAHLLIRRHHANDTVSEQTMDEAAVLVGEKSWQRHDAKAEVMVAFLRHVHPIKGAPAGTVRVDTVQRTLLVALPHKEKG